MQLQSISSHAETRMAQRGLGFDIIKTIYAYGAVRRSHGADLYIMDAEARDQARDDLGPKAFARLERALNSYLVVGDDERLVTCARRFKRVRLQ